MWTGAALALVASGTVVIADVPLPRLSELFEQGNRLYQAQDYTGARQAYESILDLGYEAPSVYYNLGNAALKTQDIGRAVWAYARAHRMEPRDADIRANLDHVRSLATDTVPARDRSKFLEILAALSSRLPSRDALRVAAVLYWLLAALGTALLVVPRVRRLLVPPAWGLGVLLVLVLFFAGMKRVVGESGRVGVVLPGEIAVHSEPGEDGKSVFSLHAGTEVRMARTIGGWVEISLGPDLKGWLPESALAAI
jgi:hypothetical protein